MNRRIETGKQKPDPNQPIWLSLKTANTQQINKTRPAAPVETFAPETTGFPAKGLHITSIEDQPIPEMLKSISRNIKYQMQTQGYVEVTEYEVEGIESYFQSNGPTLLSSFATVKKQLSFEPADLEDTPFSDAELIGAMAGGVSKKGLWSGLTRIYRIPETGTVELDEDDLTRIIGGIQLTKELINQEINGHPAIYTVQISPSGKAMANIYWVTKEREYRLSMDRNTAADVGLLESFIELAQSIPDVSTDELLSEPDPINDGFTDLDFDEFNTSSLH